MIGGERCGPDPALCERNIQRDTNHCFRPSTATVYYPSIERCFPLSIATPKIAQSFRAASSFTIPGASSAPDSCGVWYPSEFCEECGDISFSPSRCERRSCESCWSAWSRRRAQSIVERIQGARYAAGDGLDRRAVHATLSPPEGTITTIQGVYDGFRKAYSIAQEQGIRGGVAIFHGYRATQEAKAEYNADVADGLWDPEQDGRLWKWIREQPRSYRNLTQWSPHWHILGLARDVASNKPDEQEGWVCQRLSTFSAMTLTRVDSYEEIANAAMYVLSHASFEAGESTDTIRWFGEVATASFSLSNDLSAGTKRTIERRAEEAVAPVKADSAREDENLCSENGCMGRIQPIWDAGLALQDQAFCMAIGREAEKRLTAAFEWAIKEIEPPPGTKQPRTEAEAHEALETLL